MKIFSNFQFSPTSQQQQQQSSSSSTIDCNNFNKCENVQQRTVPLPTNTQTSGTVTPIISETTISNGNCLEQKLLPPPPSPPSLPSSSSSTAVFTAASTTTVATTVTATCNTTTTTTNTQPTSMEQGNSKESGDKQRHCRYSLEMVKKKICKIRIF